MNTCFFLCCFQNINLAYSSLKKHFNFVFLLLQLALISAKVLSDKNSSALRLVLADPVFISTGHRNI